jgi:hypothetical protein
MSGERAMRLQLEDRTTDTRTNFVMRIFFAGMFGMPRKTEEQSAYDDG